MDNMDHSILNLIQREFPIDTRPYRVIAEKLGIEEEEVIQRVRKMKENLHIRKLGGTFNSNKLGYKSTLCTLAIEENRIEEVAKIVNSYPGVTHNYIRNGEYNMWFTLIAESQEALEATIKEIEEKTEIHEIHTLQAKKVFKINVDFPLKAN